MTSSAQATDRTRFIVLFEARSGSTYLMESLNSHPQIVAAKEHFANLRERIRIGQVEPQTQLEWLHQFYFREESPQCRAIGFKTKLKDIALKDEVAQWLRENGLKVILLQRRNRIKLAVSLINAMRLNEKTGDWNLYRKEDRPGPLQIDVPQFNKWLSGLDAAREQLEQYARSLQLDLLTLHYEDLFYQGESTFARIFDFLGVEAHPLQAECMKNTSDDLRDVVENYDELRSQFTATKYEEMFSK